MHQNLFLRQNPPQSTDTTLSTRPENRPQFLNRPFTIRGQSISPLDHHQVSASAHWTNRQKEKYLLFVCYYRDHFKNQSYGKINWNIFKGMARFVETRNAQQCRSHHIKLLKQLTSIENYITIAMQKAVNLGTRILEAQEKLIEVQSQFKLNSLNMGADRVNQMQIQQPNFINYYQNRFFNEQISEKKQNHDQVKTADSYIQVRNPVNSNNNPNQIVDDRLGFKPYKIDSRKCIRSSIPSFDDEDNQGIKDNEESIKQNQFLKSTSFNNEINNYIYFDGQKYTIESFVQCFGKGKNAEKLKQFMECRYYFQMFEEKFQKFIGQDKVNQSQYGKN